MARSHSSLSFLWREYSLKTDRKRQSVMPGELQHLPAGSPGFVRDTSLCAEERCGVEARHLPAQPVREEPQGTVRVRLLILGFPSMNCIIFSIGINL